MRKSKFSGHQIAMALRQAEGVERALADLKSEYGLPDYETPEERGLC